VVGFQTLMKNVEKPFPNIRKTNLTTRK